MLSSASSLVFHSKLDTQLFHQNLIRYDFNHSLGATRHANALDVSSKTWRGEDWHGTRQGEAAAATTTSTFARDGAIECLPAGDWLSHGRLLKGTPRVSRTTLDLFCPSTIDIRSWQELGERMRDEGEREGAEGQGKERTPWEKPGNPKQANGRGMHKWRMAKSQRLHWRIRRACSDDGCISRRVNQKTQERGREREISPTPWLR